MIIKIDRLEARVSWIKGQHSLAPFASELHYVDVLDRELRDEVRVAKGTVGHEDAFAIRHTGAHVAPRPFRGKEQLAEVRGCADLLGNLRWSFRADEERQETKGEEDQETFHRLGAGVNACGSSPPQERITMGFDQLTRTRSWRPRTSFGQSERRTPALCIP